MRVLITGVTGMAGSHLAEYLLNIEGLEIYGTYRWRSRVDNLDDLRKAGKVNIITGGFESMLHERTDSSKLNLIEADITDSFSMKWVIGAVKPDRIFHLAAQSYVHASWGAPAETLHTNIIGEVNLLEAVRSAGIDPIIHIAGSSEEYGLVLPDELPVKETNPLRPLSPYGVSKATQEMIAYQYFMSYGLKSVITRAFNHEGPRRGEVFVTSNLAKQIVEVEKGLKPPVLYVGDLSSVRDWSDVRDVIKAYWLVTEMGTPGEVYNIGSGIGREVREMLDMLLGMSNVDIEVEVDHARLRPSDVKVLICDSTRFRKLTGWAPQITFDKTLRDLLDYWRERV
ncbi:MAG: GDP-mannose 4,6-dehydratase [Dehalococcoidia bacterium]|jgi:GDP-4-dehydro-6-deoxy-D-mannose reductase|nr:GDP-mannose 4,6-dehydratase [Dehalococcoidia bacterium]